MGRKMGDPVIVCLYGWFVSLYSCLCTLGELYKSQYCDNGGTTLSLVVQRSMKQGFKVNVCVCVCVCMCACVCVCTHKGVNQLKVSRCCMWRDQAQYVEGMLQGVLG